MRRFRDEQIDVVRHAGHDRVAPQQGGCQRRRVADVEHSGSEWQVTPFAEVVRCDGEA
jgi:hypothetical protein